MPGAWQKIHEIFGHMTRLIDHTACLWFAIASLSVGSTGGLLLLHARCCRDSLDSHGEFFEESTRYLQISMALLWLGVGISTLRPALSKSSPWIPEEAGGEAAAEIWYSQLVQIAIDAFFHKKLI